MSINLARPIQHMLVQRLTDPEILETLDNHFYAVAYPERDYSQELGVQSNNHIPVLVRYQAPCKTLQCGAISLLLREIQAVQSLLLLYRRQMTGADIYHVLATVNSFKII